ncbi:unnamed protein product [Adineta ricciae]|uniref:Uncharacterized protein n=1 Tax=Adineta ricciae TaxID=249248 RepID=A0A815QX91_ADIRI|nr:unnamed protein product [Adineta ricciae]
MSLEEHSNTIRQAIKNAVETATPAKGKTKKSWISEITLEIADEKRKLKEKNNASIQYTQQYQDLCRKVKKSPRQSKECWIQNQCEQAEKGLNIGNVVTGKG